MTARLDLPQKGFVLPLTLWIIALLGLLMASLNTWVGEAVENSRVLQRRAESDLELSNVKNELLYALAVRPLTYRGLEVGDGLQRPDRFDFQAVMAADYKSSQALAFDGRPYVLESNPDFVIRLHDTRGLINLNTITAPYLRRFLSEFNVPEPLQVRLADTLADWIDEDDATRQAGAEADVYQRLGRITPSNAALLTPMEAQSALDWDSIPQIWQADLRSPLFSTCAAAGFNPNTAPDPVLMAYVIGLTSDNEAAVMKQRLRTPFRNQTEFSAASNVITPNEAFFFSFVPAQCVIVDLMDRTSNERTRFSLSLLPTGRHQPWQLDYVYKVPAQLGDTEERAVPQDTFPAPETLYLRESGDNGTSRVQ